MTLSPTARFGPAVFAALWAFNGWSNISNMAEEMVTPTRQQLFQHTSLLKRGVEKWIDRGVLKRRATLCGARGRCDRFPAGFVHKPALY